MTAKDDWNDPHGVQDVSLAQDVIDEQQKVIDAYKKALESMTEKYVDLLNKGE